MRAKSILFAAIATGFGFCGSAYGWTALAISHQGNISYFHTDSESAQRAEQFALEKCKARGVNDCQLLGETVDGPNAVFLAVGDDALGMATNIDAQLAADTAMNVCKERSTNCKLYDGIWDKGGDEGPESFRVILKQIHAARKKFTAN